MTNSSGGFGSLESGTPLVPVNTDDLKRVWYLVQRIAMNQGSEAGAQGGGISAQLIAEQCQAGAEVLAFFFRAVLLQHMFRTGLLDTWMMVADFEWLLRRGDSKERDGVNLQEHLLALGGLTEVPRCPVDHSVPAKLAGITRLT